MGLEDSNAVESHIPAVHMAGPIVRERDGELWADSRDVAAVFGKQHKDVLKAIRNLECSQDFTQRNFAHREEIQKHSTGASRTTFVEMTRDGFAFLAMGFTGVKAAAFKEAFIAEFNRMERELRGRPAFDAHRFLNDPDALRGVLLSYSEKVIALESSIATLAPKVEALGRLAEADGSFCITDAAKNLQLRPKQLFKWLVENRWIYKRPGTESYIGYQSKIITGVLEHKTTTVTRPDGTEKVTTQVRVTPKGLTRLAQDVPPVLH